MLKKRHRNLTVTNALPIHAAALSDLAYIVYGIEPGTPCDEAFQPEHIAAQIARFPEGQFVALMGEQVVGYAITMRTRRSPFKDALPWLQMIGDLSMSAHDPHGDWLYGIDFGVHPGFRRMGIGTKLYKARFNMVKQLNLRGFYAGGMLAGYPKYHKRMSVREYARKIMHGELSDPTVTMQINRGFRPAALIEDYTTDPPPENSAMLIVWDNPQYGVASASA